MFPSLVTTVPAVGLSLQGAKPRAVSDDQV